MSKIFINQFYQILNKSPNFSKDTHFIAHAMLLSSQSTCKRLKVGCVIVLKEKIISTGYNKFLNKSSINYTIIKNNHDQSKIHAEQNALMNALDAGVKVKNSVVYITHYPCLQCTKILIEAKVSSVKYYLNYNNDPLTKKFFDSCNIPISQLS